MDYDVLVAGAGPAGAATAAALVQRGLHARRILLVDRARFPRSKPCGGGLTGHATDALGALGFELSVPHTASPDARVLCGPFERRVELPRPVEIVRREEFDQSLVDQVRARGVEVREGCGLRDFAVEQDGVTCGTDSGVVRARFLVGADGAGSLVRKRLRPHPGAGREPRPIRLFRAELPAPPVLRGQTTMLYDFTPMRPGADLRGYLWIFPVPGDRINVGLMHDPGRTRSGAQLTALLRRELVRLGVALPDGVARGWPAWSYQTLGRVSAPHLCLVGDAAGIDALTGEGIAVALEQGLVAARHLCRGLDRGDFGLPGYRRALRRATVGRELALDRWLARLLYRGRAERWLSVLFRDPTVIDLYAARVSGTLVLADQKRTLLRALGRYFLKGQPLCWS
ncbi:MAG TPA: FAD-dependent monooxygenase [Polyangia bacterium]|nr:FAD-dependent monooxygenase [Polyangia bacterium]